MRKQLAPILALFVLLLFSVPFLASPQISSLAPNQASPGQMPLGEQMAQMLKGKPLLPQGSDGGFWRTDHGFVSTLMLKNMLVIAPITATPVLYMSDGTEYDLPPVNLDAAGVAVLNINEAMQYAPSNIQPHISTYGSAGIRFKWLWAGAVAAAVRTGDDVRSLVYQSHLSADIVKVNDPAAVQSPQTLEGMWWKQDENTRCFITLTNTSKINIKATVQVFDSGATDIVNRAVVVPPHNTQFMDVTSLWGQLPYGTDQGGLRVSYTAARDALVVEGGLEDDVTGYSHVLRIAAAVAQPTGLPFSASPVRSVSPVSTPASSSTIGSPQTGMSTVTPPETINLDSPGIMVGAQDPNMQFPQGTRFMPYLILRNMTGSPMQVQIGANYPKGPTPTDTPLGTVTLPAEGVQQIDVKEMLAGIGLDSYNGLLNLRTSFYGSPSDIMEESGSVDQSKSYVFEVPPIMEAPSRGKILSFWNTSGDTDSMITLWNYSSKDQDFILNLYHQAGQYKLPIHLSANASVTIDVAFLIKSGKPDADGNTIPTNVVQGSAKLSGPRGDMDIIDVALHGAVFNVRTGTCTCACVYCNYVTCNYLTPGDLTEGVGEVTNECAYLIFMDGNCCNISLNMNWNTSSGDSSIATVDENGDVTGVGPGITTITGQSADEYDSPIGACLGGPGNFYCPMASVSFSANITVHPVITSIDKSTRLWFFGTGISPNGYDTSETLTAQTQGGFVNGTYVWTITNGTSKVTLPNNSSTDTVTNTTTIGLSSTSFSTSANDVTVQVQYTSPDGKVNTTKTVNLDVDAPYQLASNGSTTTSQVDSCYTDAPGSSGFSSDVPYKILSFFGVQISNIGVNETFGARSDIYSGNNWPSPTAGHTLSTLGLFSDQVCEVFPSAVPPTNPPGAGTALVFQQAQSWFIGSQTNGSGLKIQLDSIEFFQNHGDHTLIISPLR